MLAPTVSKQIDTLTSGSGYFAVAKGLRDLSTCTLHPSNSGYSYKLASCSLKLVCATVSRLRCMLTTHTQIVLVITQDCEILTQGCRYTRSTHGAKECLAPVCLLARLLYS